MKKLFFALSLLIACGASAQKANTLLWKVTSPEGKTSHLFGTYHLINSGFLEESPRVKEAFEQSETVVVETVIDSTRLLEMAMAMMMQGQTLHDLLDSSEYQMVDTVLQKRLGVGLALLNNMKPMALNTMYAAALAQENLPEDLRFEGQPMDVHFAQQGRKTGKEIVALETMMEQARLLFDSESVEDQADALVEVMRNEEESLQLTIALAEAYKKEELQSLRKIADESDEDYGSMDALLEERNKNWMPILKEVVDSGGAFIAVGALHLTGDDGLIKLLEDEKYKVEPVFE